MTNPETAPSDARDAVPAELEQIIRARRGLAPRQLSGTAVIEDKAVLELLERVYEMGWTHGTEGRAPDPRAAIDGARRLSEKYL